MTSTRSMVITLFCVALVCSIVLSFVYSYTAPRIEKTKQELMLSGLQDAIDAAEFEEIIPDTVWCAVDSNGEKVGIVFRVFPQGYAGPIPITVGLDLAGVVTGIRIASAAEGMNETPGLGAKILEDDFKNQFVGKTGDQVLLKKDGGEIDGITAATISSRAVCRGVQTGIKEYGNYITEFFDPACVFADADSFVESVEDTLWYALSENDTIGLVFVGSARGYAGQIVYAGGVNIQGEIVGITVVSSEETPGIGDVIEDETFLEKFKTGIPGTVSGATVSTKALINGVKKDVKRFQEYLP